MNKFYSFIIGALLIADGAYAADRKTVNISWNGNKVTVKGDKMDSLTVKSIDGKVLVENLIESNALTFVLSGKSDAGSFEYKGKHKTYFELNNLSLNSTDSIPLNLKNGKNNIVILKNNNSLSVSADTLNGAFIRTKGKLTLEGEGSLTMKSATVGCKGIKVGEDFIMNGGNVSIETSGRFIELNNNPFGGFGGFGGPDGEMPNFGGGFPGGMPDFGGGFPGGMPNFGGGFPGGMPDFGGGFPDGMPDFGGGFPGGGFGRPSEGGESGDDDDMMFKQKVNGSTKGVRATGTVTINGGKLTIRTSTYAAEGLEGKKGVTINGGVIEIIAKDDAINSSGPIVFNGGTVTAVSMRNDAVDSNSHGDGAISIHGGDIEVVSLMGPPEEGFDSDFSALIVTGGNVFSVGGSMAGSPSAPNANTAKQPTLLINGIDITEGTDVIITDSKGKEVVKYTPKYSLQSSHSLITSPLFKQGESYKVVVKGETLHEFTFTDRFVTIGNAGGGFGGFGGFPGGGFGGPGGGPF